MYKLYLDKQEDFQCDVAVKNASLKDAFARVIVEGDDCSLMFKGQIKDGKCNVPIKRLKGLLEENTKGKMHLEVVVEDTYFKPWTSDYIVEEHTSVKVAVKEQSPKSKKPLLEVKVKENTTDISDAAKHISLVCERFGINKKTLGSRKDDFKQVVKEYFKSNPSPEYQKYIQEAMSALK